MDAEAHEQKRASDVRGWSFNELIRIGEGRPLSTEERAHTINTVLPGYFAQHGGRIIGRSEQGITIAVPRKPVNHLLHLLLTLLTVGLWIPMWAYLTAQSNKEDRKLITVDETGNVRAFPVESRGAPVEPPPL